MNGILYGIGVGPGDPELMTLKALRCIRESDVIILPSAPKEECYAYQIVRQVCPEVEQKKIICLPFPMIKDKEKLKQEHDAIFSVLCTYLEAGKTVGFLTIGDASVYSTYSYMHTRAVKAGKVAYYVSGVPSFCAVAATLGISLGDNRDEIHIIPGSYEIEESMKLSGTKIYMKSGKKLLELLDSLKAQNIADERIFAVSNCGLPSQKIAYGMTQIRALDSYLTIVIVK